MTLTADGSDSILHKIAETARRRVQQNMIARPLAQIENEWRTLAPQPKDFSQAFQKTWNVIAEIKKASPSQGDIAVDIDHCLVAKEYLQSGAAALSVLTEPFFFKGKIEYLEEIRRAHPDAYLLEKDFVVDTYQIYEAALAGADCILLIVAMLGPKQTEVLFNAARKIGISVLMEVHDKDELDIAKSIGAKIIGVNNRNLKDMSLSLDRSRELIGHIPKDAIGIAESGIKDSADLRELSGLGYRGFLVGTQLMRGGQAGKALKELLGG